jgi:hypothetical protein
VSLCANRDACVIVAAPLSFVIVSRIVSRKRAIVVSLVALMLAAPVARAAEVTRVVSAFDQNDTFDFNLTATWLHDVHTAAVNREFENTNSDNIQLGKDLKYAQTTDVINLRTDFGVLWDVGLHVQLPIVIASSNNLTFDSQVDDGNSTFVRDGIYPAYNNASPRPSTVFQSPTRSGPQSLGVGLDWAVFNERRDDTKPTWTLGFDAMLDIFKDQRFDPANPNGNTATGLGYHQLIWSTWISKRFRYFDPYFGASYMLPIRTNGSIFQSEGPTESNSGPQQMAAVVIGVEEIAWENPATLQRVTIEVQGHMEEHFAGRGFSELWEPLSGSPQCTPCRPSLDEVTQSPVSANGVLGTPVTAASPYPGVSNIDAYGSFGGDLGLNVQVGKYIRFRSLFGLTVDAPHFITNASAGIDANGNGQVNSADPREANPVYRESIDIPGRRFKIEESKDWRLLVQGSLMF